MSDFSDHVFAPSLRLSGRMLVEASAGTGKTYNIQNIYLRLVLADNMTVQQILVVTFTEAATRELRERLRAILLRCRDRIGKPVPVDDPDHHRLVSAFAVAHGLGLADEVLNQRVQLALMDFDSAAIFTIHGFCNRVLERYAFECGHDPDAELMPEQSRIIRDACRDWWRRNAYGAAGGGVVPLKTLEELQKLVTAVVKRPDAKLRPSSGPRGDTALPAAPALIAACQSVWNGIGDLRANVSWIGRSCLRRAAKGHEVPVEPIVDCVRQHAKAFSGWLAASAEALTSPAAGKVIEATAQLLRESVSIPASGDAKPFAKAVQTLAGLPLDSVIDPYARGKIMAIAGVVAEDVRARITGQSALTYDAMLLNVRAVLDQPDAGARSKELLRQEFKAALIDEFQDTDPVQYAIFKAIFADGDDATPHPLVYVGDPKQAIYGFRGGDVFTYYAAKGELGEDRLYSLEKNFRSEQNVVHAVNELFSDASPEDRTFINRSVPYDGTLGANDVKADKELLVDGVRDKQPLRVWTYDCDGRKYRSVAQNGDMAKVMYADVAREVVALLSDGTVSLGGRRVRPKDIAVLVLVHDEAEAIQRELHERGVNAVRQATGDVFDSDVAPELALVMEAMIDSGRAGAIRSAMCAKIIPCDEARIAAFKADAEGAVSSVPASGVRLARFEDWVEIFREAGLRWQKRSFVEAFRYLAAQLDIRTQVVGGEDGSRRMTDIQHLVELAHSVAREQKLGPVALVRWFVRQLDKDTRDDGEAAKTRVSDDDDAVRIMTVFKSKGLEFPIVFVPTLWRRKAVEKRSHDVVIKYHDDDNTLVLDLDVESQAHRAVAENLEENIRLAYVALTRARNRVYLWSVENDKVTADAYALTRLLERWRARKPAGGHVLDEPAREDWSGIPAQWAGAPAAAVAGDLRAVEKPVVDKTHGHASFSSLAPHDLTTSKGDPAARDVDAGVAGEGVDEPAVVAAPSGIFAIPGGAKTGNCWHEIFENVDFRVSREVVDAVVRDALDKYGICRGVREMESRAAVHAMVQNVLRVPLNAGHGTLSLKDIEHRARRSELGFQFSLRRDGGACSVDKLAGVLGEHWDTKARDQEFIDRLSEADAELPFGFMTGFMDLVFQHNGRFYIVDWKSNRRGGRDSDFDADGLKEEMARHSYYLQYMIYTVALDGFLGRTLSGYDYEKHFGGVFYLFLRGVDGTSQQGVFTDRPSRELVEVLGRFLSERNGGAL